MKKIYSISAVIVGILFIGLAFIYWSTPANLLPSFLPGHDASLTQIHFKHGLGAFFLGLGALAYAWFSSGKKK